MKTTKFQRITALILLVMFIFGGSAMPASAARDSSEENSLASIKELLNAISYSEYKQEYTSEAELAKLEDGDDSTNPSYFDLVPNASSDIVLAGVDGTYVNSLGDVLSYDPNVVLKPGDPIPEEETPYKFTDGTNEGLYVPDSGDISWVIAAGSENAISTPTRYSIYIEYYPIQNKSASIERIFMINDKVPFAEARYLTISKVWSTPYPDAQIEIGREGAAAIIEAAKAAGFLDAKEGVNRKGEAVVNVSFPSVWTQSLSDFVDEYTVRYFTADTDKNEIRESLVQAPKWNVYDFKDSNGFDQKPFQFVVAPDEDGDVTLTLEGVNEPIVISKLCLTPCKDYQSYDAYRQQYASLGKGEGALKIEAEYFSASSSQTIYPMSDNTSAANSPSATDRTLLNAVGGEKWQGVGQWVEYKFTVAKSGNYNIVARFKQNILDGMATSRVLNLYSDDTVAQGEPGYYNGVPFDEATRLKFNYSDDWQVGPLSDGTTDFEFYFKAGVTYTIRLEVSLGAMGSTVSRVQESLDAINKDYLNILKLTGTTPDEFASYDFYGTIPDTMADMWKQHEEIDSIIEVLLKDSSKSSMTATLQNVSDLLRDMSKDEDEVAKNLAQLKTYIGSLGTWLGDAKTQPLTVDYLVIQNADTELPKAKANFFEALWHEITGFIQSFFRNYDRMGALTDEVAEDSVEVWIATGRDQSQVIRNLINNKFTKEHGVTVNLRLVAGGTLLPSILAKKGPDVYLGIGAGDVINYAIRGALESIEEMDGFKEATSNFNESAMIVLQMEDAYGKMRCYGLPETQSFPMMFVREDVLAELEIEVPKTWDDVKEAIPVLQANNMEIAMIGDSNIFIYQMGGELFADGGMRINLGSNLALTAFEDMCAMYTMYSFPYKYDFANRFRTGEMPIGFGDYTGTYNHLKVFATEIEGLWSFYPMPGIEDKNGDIRFDSVSGVGAISMIVGAENKERAWTFMKWYVGNECQVDYSNEMAAILGPSAKHPTANITALESLPWTREEYSQIKLQFDNLASIPNYPGAYIVGRYTKFAFLDAYNDNLNPVTSLKGYIDDINDEITRKREEFDLEALDKDKGQTTLAVRRMQQAEEALELAKSDSRYSATYDAKVDEILREINGYDTEDFGRLTELANDLSKLNSDLFGNGTKDSDLLTDAELEKDKVYKAVYYLTDAAKWLKTYEAYKNIP
ncbi:MAG: extracellular solute-binding protein [Ruminococcaceae bacterium]|nr:extracellular solute-binding protein [Oscillospiraceae bacterium]